MKIININDSIKAFLDKESADFSPKEKILFPLLIIAIVVLSFLVKDSKIALISAICGISYTIFNGKGKIYCYFFGITGTLLYSYLAFKNGLLGNFSLNFFYYLPLEIIGLISWKKHLINKTSVKKTSLKKTQRVALWIFVFIATIVLALIIIFNNLTILNFLDFLTLFLSIIAMILAVKRLIEQWYLWSTVNFLSVIIWSVAYLRGSNCFATIVMWGIYFVLGIYFLKKWQREIKL